MQRAVADENALVYAFGERWGPEAGVKDKYFGFLPGNGIHDIHMNQGNSGRFTGDDGVFQDGGLLVHFPDQHEWTAMFLKFQSQAWHTDDRTGHTIAAPAPRQRRRFRPSRARHRRHRRRRRLRPRIPKVSSASSPRWSMRSSRRRSRWSRC